MKKIITLLALAFCLHGWAQSAIITTIAGNGTAGYAGNNGQATSSELNYPTDIKIDAMGNLYIADQLNNVIRKIDLTGSITTIAGSGAQGYTGDGGLATASELYNPTNIVFDAAGNLIFSDRNNNVVRKINTNTISTIAGTGTFGFSGDGGQASLCTFKYETGLAIDIFKNLFIVDENNNRIRKIDTNGIISTIAGTGTAGFSGDGGNATLAELYQPRYINFDALGNLYIADQYNHCIRKISSNGIITTVVGTNSSGYYGDGGLATNAKLYNPRGVVVDGAGNLFIADTYNNVIRKVNTSGIITTIAGTGSLGYSGDGGLATNAKFNTPIGMTIDASGNLYIADAGNNCIRKITNVTQTGISQISSLNTHISIYPNPSNGIFLIETNATTKQNVQVYDVNGRVVLTQFITGKTTIDASGLQSGIYNLSIISIEGITNKRLVITH